MVIKGLIKQPIHKAAVPTNVIDNIKTQADYDTWATSVKVSAPGDEPDTKSAFGVDFEISGISPHGWIANPYDTETYTMDQVGLAKLFADQYCNTLRFCTTSSQWYIFVPKIGWVRDDSGHYVGTAIRAFKAKLNYAAQLIDDNAFYRFFCAKRLSLLGTHAQIRAVLKLAETEYPFDSADMDTREDIIATRNGIIQLYRDGRHIFRSFTASDMTSYHMATDYDASAQCPVWTRTVDQVFGGDQGIIVFFQIFLGQMLWAKNDQKAFAIFLGSRTNNGKSTIMTTLSNLLGDYSVAVSDKLIRKKGTPTVDDKSEMAAIKGKLLATLPEPDRDLVADGDAIKRITGGDVVKARYLYQEHFAFVPFCTLIIGSNYYLNITDTKVFERGSLILFRFDESFTGHKVDTQLSDKIKMEYPGILNWLLEGWAKYCKLYPNGAHWTLPKSMQDDIDQYYRSCDILGQYIDDCYDITGNRYDTVPRTVVYDRYKSWYADNGDGKSVSAKSFHGDFAHRLATILGLPGHDIPVRKLGDGTRCYYGLKIKH